MTENIVKYNKVEWRKRLLISTPTEGLIRFEWAHARHGQVIPVNWEASGFDLNYVVCGYSIEDAYNVITKTALERNMEWLVIVEDDVLIPPDCFLRLADYILDGKIPVVSGLYYTKSEPAIPLLFRGRGNGAFNNWTLGDKVWVDGLPMGCLLIHTSILQWFWDNNAEEYRLPDGQITRRVFETPKKIWYDPEAGGVQRQEGTQDLHFFDRLIEHDVIKKTGWKSVARRKYQLLCDTNILCRHIDRSTGRAYP